MGALGDVSDLDVLELGCGAAQWSIALTGRGARCVGLDASARQLEHAARNLADAGMDFPLVHSQAESLPFDDATFDVVFCDHGAIGWSDPLVLVPEAARVLRPGGLLAFSMVTPFLDCFWTAEDQVSERLQRDYFGLHAFSDDDGTTHYQLPYGEWIRLFRRAGLEVEDLVELQPPEGATTSYDLAPLAWARRWPAEHVWKARRR